MQLRVGAPACRQAGRSPAPLFDCVFGRGQATPLHPPIGWNDFIRIAVPTEWIRLRAALRKMELGTLCDFAAEQSVNCPGWPSYVRFIQTYLNQPMNKNLSGIG